MCQKSLIEIKLLEYDSVELKCYNKEKFGGFNMKKLNIGVIYGGISSEHLVSRASANTIISNLSQEKYNVIPIYINKEGSWIMYDNYKDDLKDFKWEKIGVDVSLSVNQTQKGLLRLVRDKAKLISIDIVFPVLHGLNGEDGTIQGLFEFSGIPYVGCGVLSSAISMDKSFMRLVAKNIGLNQTEYLAFKAHDFKKEPDKIVRLIKKEIDYPCFIKPCNGGSSIGIKKVKNKKELLDAIDLALHHDKKIMAEKAICGREFECAVLGDSFSGEVNVSGVGEIKCEHEFYDYDAKYMDKSSYTVIPADLPKKVIETIKDYSSKIFQAVDGSGLARIDFFVEDGTNEVFFNEINTMPGFTSISMYPKLWEAEGISIGVLLDKLIDLGLKKDLGREQKIWKIEQ